jgi:phenylacetate-CoA ligase
MEPLIILKTLYQIRKLQKNDRRPLEETLVDRDAALERVIRFARTSSPFYSEFHKGLEDAPLSDLPVLTKGTMMDRFDDLVTDRSIRLADVERHLEQLPAVPRYLGRYRVCSTSGSTGRRGFFLFDGNEWATAIASFRRSASWSGAVAPSLLAPMAVVATTVPWHVTSQARTSMRLPWVRVERFDAADPIESLTERLNELRPGLVTTYPSVGRALAKEQIEGRLRISPRVVFTGSEVLTHGVRSLMDMAWGEGHVYDHYGATETGSIAAECVKHRLHMAEDLLVVEAVDRENRPVPAGIASDKLLVTVLFRRTQPLIRYEISDRVVVSAGRCDCGLPWKVLERVEGRDEEMLRLPATGGGTRDVHPLVFEGIFDNLPVSGWQVTSNGNDVTALLSGAAGIDIDMLRDRIWAELAQRGVSPASVTTRRVAELPRTATGKASHVRKEPQASRIGR